MNKFWIIGSAVIILLMGLVLCMGFRKVNPTDEELIEYYCKIEKFELVEFRGLSEMHGEAALSYIAIDSEGYRVSGQVNRDWVLSMYKTFH
jgi:hypothetical protein